MIKATNVPGVGPRASLEAVAPRLLLVIAIAIAAVTRLGWLGLIEFQNDEAWALRVAEGIARGQAFPLVGIGSSLDIPNAPFFVYLMALPELISRDPALATGLIGLLGTLAVAATYGFAKSLFDPLTAAAAALLYAVSPWGIIYSRKIWGQDALPLFVTLGFWALFTGFRSKQRFWVAPGIVSLALATQLHPTAFFLGAPALVLIVGSLALDRSRVRRSVGWLGLGLLGAALVEAPFLVWQAQHGWPLIGAVHRLASGPGRIDLEALRLAWSAVAGSGYPVLAEVGNHWWPAALIEVALLVGGIVLLLRTVVNPGAATARLRALVLLVWLAAPVLAQLHHEVPLYPHYFIVLYPASFIVMGVAVAAVWKYSGSAIPKLARRDKFGVAPAGLGKLGAGVALAVPVVLGVVAFQGYIAALGRGAVQPGFGVPLVREKALFTTARQLAGGGPVYLASHDSLAPALDYLGDHRWRIFDGRHGLRLPDSAQGSVLVISDPTSTAARLAARWLGAGRAKTMTLARGNVVALYHLAPGVREANPEYHVLNQAFANGMTLDGYRIQSDPAQRVLRVDLHWRFAGLPPSKPPTVFNHLVGPTGETVSAKDGLAYDPTDWRPGEIGLDEFDLPWPTMPGPYHLQVGLYDYPSMQRFRLLDPATGQPDDLIDIGPISLK